MLTVGFVLETLFEYTATGREPEIAAVVIDSREVRRGSLIVAFRGDNVDGHDYVEESFAKGAIAALVERPIGDYPTLDTRQPPELEWSRSLAETAPLCIVVENTLVALQKLAKEWRRRFKEVRIIGITGSVGKTTTKELTHSVLSQKYDTLKSQGNYNNEIGLPLTLLELRPRHEKAVLEMGMYTSGEISLLCDLAQPQVGVVTIVGSVHMEWLGSREAIARAKRELIEMLPSAPEGIAILNKDDPLVMQMSDFTDARVVTYGLDPLADYWADDIESRGLEGIRFTLHHGNDNFKIHVPLLGRHSVHTSLRAAAVGHVEGMTWDEIAAGLAGLQGQLRLVAVPGPGNSIILDDTYNSSPESAVAALNLLEDLDGRRVAVLGDMLELGPVEESSHRLVGRRAKEVADILVAVGPLGRLIGEEALVAQMAADCVHLVDTPEEAIPVLQDLIEPGDIVLVKGSHGAHLEIIVSSIGQG